MYTKIPIGDLSREEWLHLRKSGIGGSDAGAICGVNPFSSPMKVYRDKTCDIQEEQDNESIRQGHDLEQYVAERFVEATGLKVRRSNYMYRSTAHPFMIADVDRLVVGEDAGLECKTASAYNADKWKDGEIPLHYIMQCYHYMAVTGKRTWYIAAVILGREFVYRKLEWDDELIRQMIDIEQNFYNFVKNILKEEAFAQQKISKIKTSDAKLFLIKMQQEDKRGHSTVKTVRGVLRPAFQMAVDDDVLMKNPFQFELAGVVVNDSVTREAVTKDQMRKFLRFVHDDILYCKYYEVVYILFHTGMRISEFCGLTLKDIDLKNKTVNIDHQLQRTSKREYVIEPTKTNAGTRVIPITDEVAEMFRSIIEDRPKYKVEKVVAGYSGFLFLDKDGMPLVAMHWEHRFNSMVGRYNEIYKVQMPNITPHVCRHTYCSNQAKAGMNPKTLQYLMGHSDIAVTLNVYTHVGLEDAENELRKMQTLEGARKEMGLSDKDDKPLKQTMFKVV